MGLSWNLECKNCGYKFYADWGNGGFGASIKKIPERIYTVDDETSKIIQIMGSPEIVVCSHPYICHKCRSFFNYVNVNLISSEGVYVEKTGICPTCNQKSHIQIRMDELKGKEQYGYGECTCRCPKCLTKMHIIRAGIYD